MAADLVSILHGGALPIALQQSRSSVTEEILWQFELFPRAMGSDFSGTVLAIGAGVTRIKPGDRVFGVTSPRKVAASAKR
jgi:NADPH:quinone reductase-like Zn-dependent oxidoreductase